jgi:hypothetical protein
VKNSIYIDPGEINPLTRVRFSGYCVQGLTLKVRNVVVLLGAVKVYVTAVDVLRKRERQDETQFLAYHKIIDGFLSFTPL